jgi:hypothetical protein
VRSILNKAAEEPKRCVKEADDLRDPGLKERTEAHNAQTERAWR